ncbi:MAG: hypothetical protein ACRCWW_00015 [Scandinavium sp.]|uniref:hypothetical protein n=1 Tax=Scandinavium sp. TaxID=2830653 RepID=UPI003F2A5935
MSGFPTVSAPASGLADYSGYTIANESVEIIPADKNTRLVTIYNLSNNETIWINKFGAKAAASVPGCYPLEPGDMYEFITPFGVSLFSAVSAPFTAERY